MMVKQMKCQSILVEKSQAVFLYWLLEGYENLFSFTTERQPVDNTTKKVNVFFTCSCADEAQRVLAEIVTELPGAVFS